MTDGRDEMQRRANEAMANWKGDPRDAEIERLRAALREIECGELTDRPAETRAFARAALEERT